MERGGTQKRAAVTAPASLWTSQASEMASVGRLAREALPHLRLLAVGTACLVAAALADLGLTQTTGRLLDLLGGPAPADKMEAIDAAFWRLGGCFCVIAIVKHIGEYLLRLAGEQLSARVRKQLCLAIVCQPVSYFDSSATGELVSLLWMDVEGLRLAVAFHVRVEGRRTSAAGMCL